MKAPSQIKIKILRDVEGEIVPKIEDAYFPPIVELHADLNATALPIEEQENAYRAIMSSFEALKNNKSSHKLLEECMLATENNFLWFCTFFKELEKQIKGKRDIYNIPYELTPKTNNKIMLYFQHPMYLKENIKGYTVFYKKYRGETLSQSLIYRHRAELISKRLEYTDFRNGFPKWYAISHIVFEKYSSKINKRVRLYYNANGEFEYYISGASDNWEQIFNVPIEIDDVVACILFDD